MNKKTEQHRIGVTSYKGRELSEEELMLVVGVAFHYIADALAGRKANDDGKGSSFDMEDVMKISTAVGAQSLAVARQGISEAIAAKIRADIPKMRGMMQEFGFDIMRGNVHDPMPQ